MPEYRNEKSDIIIKKKKRKIGLIIFNIIDFVLVCLIAVLFYVTMPITSTKILFIPKGRTSHIISYLNKNGFEMGIVDELVIKSLGYVQSGWIDIGQERLTRLDFIYKLITAKAALKNITLIPGETSYVFFKKFATEFNLSEEKLTELYNQYAYKADGNILAETYSLPLGMKEDYMIFYLFSQTNKKYEEFSTKIFGYYDKRKWFGYLTLASVIQKEAATTNEMPIISSVVHNRLKKGMKLQMDGTLNYGIYSNEIVTAEELEKITQHITHIKLLVFLKILFVQLV